MKTGGRIPERGDLVWIDMDPQAGREQAGRRPSLVVSSSLYNGRSGLALFCPITTQVKGYPFEVPIPEDVPVKGVILADQVKNMDWRARKAKYICRLPDPCVELTVIKICRLFG